MSRSERLWRWRLRVERGVTTTWLFTTRPCVCTGAMFSGGSDSVEKCCSEGRPDVSTSLAESAARCIGVDVNGRDCVWLVASDVAPAAPASEECAEEGGAFDGLSPESPAVSRSPFTESV